MWNVNVGRMPKRSPMHNECKEYALNLEGDVGLIYVRISAWLQSISGKQSV